MRIVFCPLKVMSKVIYQCILIFMMGTLGMWKAIPFGYVLKAHPTAIFVMASTGGMLGIVILYFFGNKLKKYIFRNKVSASRQKKSNRAIQLLKKYGVGGLGFFGSILIGPPLTILLGVAIVNSPKKLLYWVLASSVFWCFILTITGYYSIELFHEITDKFKIF